MGAGAEMTLKMSQREKNEVSVAPLDIHISDRMGTGRQVVNIYFFFFK